MPRPPRGSAADLRRRLDLLPFGHPSSPYHDDGSRKPPTQALKQLELPLTADAGDGESGRPDPRGAATATAGPGSGLFADLLSRAAARSSSAESPRPGTASPDAPASPAELTSNGTAGHGTAVLAAATSELPANGHTPAPEALVNGQAPAREAPANGQAGHGGDLGGERAGLPLGAALGWDGVAVAAAEGSGFPVPAETLAALPAGPGHGDQDPPARPPGHLAPLPRAAADLTSLPEPPAQTAARPGTGPPLARPALAGPPPAGPPSAELAGRPGDGDGRHAAGNGPAAGRADGVSRPEQGWWEWRGARLSPQQARAADQVYAQYQAAEGRNVFGGYGRSGLTPAMRQLESQLDYGQLAPETERFALRDANQFRFQFARLVARHQDVPAGELAYLVPDVIRYAYVFPAEHYADGTWEVHRLLRDHGFVLEERRNGWAGTEYPGIRSRWLDPAHRLSFAVQFHTPESLTAQMRGEKGGLARPAGCAEIGDYYSEAES